MALRIAALLVITLSLSACGSTHKASQSTFQSLRRALAHQYDWQLQWLPASVTVTVSKRRAERTADYSERSTPGLSATLVRVTDHERCTERPDGICRLLINHRAAWIVVLPNDFMPCHECGPHSYGGTRVVLVDANRGRVLESVAVDTG